MLSVRPRINELTFRVYSRSLHPELLDTHAARSVERENYRMHLAITSAGHSIRLHTGGATFVEVATSSHHDLPQQCELFGQKIKKPFMEEIHLNEQVVYRCSVSLETVEPRNLFTFNQIIDKADQSHSLVHQFGSNGRIAMGAMSFLKFESRIRTARIRAIHTFPDTCQVLTSESSFEIQS